LYYDYRNALAIGGIHAPDPLPGLCPWTALGDSVPQTPCLAPPPSVNPKYATECNANSKCNTRSAGREKIKMNRYSLNLHALQ